MKYIIDTNALIREPQLTENYDVVVTSHILREIEDLELKRKSDRQLQYEIRKLKRYLEENEHFHIDLKDYKYTLDDGMSTDYVDNIIVSAAYENKYGIITNDRLMIEKAKLYNIPTVNPSLNEGEYIEHKGFKQAFMTESSLLTEIYQDLGNNKFELLTNEYLVIYDADKIDDNDPDNEDNLEVIDILKWNGESLQTLGENKKLRSNQFGEFEPRDEFQIMAVDSILSNDITSLRGKAGSGKSLITLSILWRLVEEEGYKLVIFANPSPSADSEYLGYYKGDRLEKLAQSSVFSTLQSKFGDKDEVIYQVHDGKLDILPFSDLRGYDSGSKELIWVMEGQNLSSELLKLGLQRVGEGSKIVIDGDFHQQIDKSVYVHDNGMKRMSEVFRGKDMYGEVELQKVYRNKIGEIAELM